jgi:hypothetical protein
VSQERPNVEQVREAVAAFNRRDLDAYLALMEPDVELTPYERAVEGLGPIADMTASGRGGERLWRRCQTSGPNSISCETPETWCSREAACTGPAHKAARLSSGPCGSRFKCGVRRAVSWHTFASVARRRPRITGVT